MASNTFVYDPSASIKESFKDVQSNISSAFTNIISQKQQDLALADKVFQNLDAITEQTAAIGSARINEGIKALTAAAPGVMFKDGKMNFEGVGQIMQGVSKIKQLKNYWSNASEIKKQYLSVAAASNKDMVSLSSFVSKLDPMIAENEGGSIEDLKKKVASLYDNHLDYSKMAREKVASFLPVDKITGEMPNTKGGIDAYSFEAPAGMVFDPNTKKVTMPAPEVVKDPATGQVILDPTTNKPKTISYLDKAKSALSQGDPDFFNRYRNHYGLSSALVNDDAVAMQVLDSFSKNPSFKEIKSKSDIQKSKNEAIISDVEAKNVGELTALKKKQIKQSIATSRAQELAANARAAGKSTSGAPKNAVRPVIGFTKDGSRFMNLTKPIVATITGANKGLLNKSGKPGEFEIDKIIIDRAGHIFAQGKTPSSALGSQNNVTQNVMLSKADYDAFINKLGGQEAVHRYSNATGLTQLNIGQIPKSYLNIQQDTNPDQNGADGWEPVD
jgi:hypothetical protein